MGLPKWVEGSGYINFFWEGGLVDMDSTTQLTTGNAVETTSPTAGDERRVKSPSETTVRNQTGLRRNHGYPYRKPHPTPARNRRWKLYHKPQAHACRKQGPRLSETCPLGVLKPRRAPGFTHQSFLLPLATSDPYMHVLKTF